jgi:nitrite reductase/ring-hydroxylating ferredoxin subunit
MAEQGHHRGNAAPANAASGTSLKEIRGEDVLLERFADRVVRVPARCPHRGGPLVEGRIIGTFLECRWHGATFDLRTGRRLREPECGDPTIIEGISKLDNSSESPNR